MEPGRARTLLADADAAAVRTLADLGAEISAITEARRDANSDDEHDPEGATIAYERSQADSLRRLAEERRTAVAAAVARLDEGTYGICVRCGRPIAEGRLEARPWADTCVEHAR
jgi:RNA polymerase-binding transcription factor DksA